MPEIKNGIGPDHIVREGDTVIKNGIGPDHIVESIECGGGGSSATTIFVSNIKLHNSSFSIDQHLPASGGTFVNLIGTETWEDCPYWYCYTQLSKSELTQEYNVPESEIDLSAGSPFVDNFVHGCQWQLRRETRTVYIYETDFDWDNSNSKDGEAYWDLGDHIYWLVDVLQFKNNQLKIGKKAFNMACADSITALDSLDISNLTDISDMFQRAYNFNQDISGWDTSNVTDMSNMFEKSSTFDQDLSSWCVSQIASKPNSFDTNSGFEGQTAKQPKWGQPC